MTENLESAVSSLGEQTKKLEIASYYTHGDMDKAKKMVSGAYKDMYAVKITFSSSIYGALLFFFNPVYVTASEPYLIVSPSFSVDDMKTNIGWREFEVEIAQNLEKKEHDDVLLAHMRDELVLGMNMEFLAELKRLVELHDEIAVNRHFMKLIQNKLGFQKLNISVDYEPSSSLEMELESRSSKKLDPRELDKKKEKPAPEAGEKEEDDPLKDKEIKLILQGSLILSPIKGIDIKELKVGDRIMISIVDTNPKAVDVAKAFNAYEEERIKPIPGRIVSIRHQMHGGYKIFAIVAKGIFIRIEEEEESIKVAIDTSVRPEITSKSREENTRAMMPLIVTLMIILSMLIALILYFVMA